jgi:hypothetical protein
LSNTELAADLEDRRGVVRRLESPDSNGASANIRREIGRRAYQLRNHYEGVRLLSVLSDRTLYETGSSPRVQFEVGQGG